MLEHKSVNISFSYSDSFEFADKNKTSDEYEYDANGNLTKDMNKGISEITYDACNQPRTIKFDGGKSIKYVYSVDGRKLSVAYISPLENLSNASANAFTATFDAVTAVEEPKLVSGTGTFSTVSAAHNGDTSSSISDIQASANKTNLSSIDKIAFVAPELGKAIGEKINLVSNISVTEYVGNFIFENGNLTTCLTDDGYMSFTSAGKPEFHYYIKDHLGSNRIVADENGNIEQKTHYYAYGGIIGDISTNPETQKYKYNGKEYDTMHGLNTYDYGARQYDGAKIVWDRMDPLCEKKPWNNPYVFCGANPINRIDPDGMDWVEDADGSIRWDPKVTKDNYKEKLKEGQIYRGTSYERQKIWTNVNVKGNLESGVMLESYDEDGKLTYKNLTPWIDIAIEEMNKGISETGNNPEITKYFQYTQLSENGINGDQTPWCAAFVNYCLEESKIDGSKMATAFSFLGFGQNLGDQNPIYGSIAVMKYSHVGFVVGTNADGRVIIVGGNQGNAVNLSPNANSSVVKYVYPKGFNHTSLPLPKYNLKSHSLTFSTSR